MLFDVILIREAGWALPRFRSCMHHPIRGDLLIRDVADKTLHRTTRLAQLRDPVSGMALDVPRPLYDAVLLCVERDYMTLTGFERIYDELGQREYHFAQSWLLTPVEPEAAA